uniref:Ankyrin repeat and SOCS box protein 5-like n=1 Tax=Phallusia mammillata TaxID=59560 RepID=A0A6F9D6R5_9ASCI|nr:ankyrin repeat and SOCS box protein 5-like [Phallusia mammillata]
MNVKLCRTELHEASFNGRALQLQTLLNQGGNVNSRTQEHDTPLHDACLGGKRLCVKVLIQHGANLDAVNITGRTPLYNACWNGSSDCCTMLLKTGASPYTEGLSSLQVAIEKGHCKCVIELIKAQAKEKFKSGSSTHFTLNHKMSLEKLVWKNSLHVAACTGNVKMIETLLSLGASPYTKNEKQITPKELTVPFSECYEALHQAETNPRSLMGTCRLALLYHKTMYMASKINIPNALEQYLRWEN